MCNILDLVYSIAEFYPVDYVDQFLHVLLLKIFITPFPDTCIKPSMP